VTGDVDWDQPLRSPYAENPFDASPTADLLAEAATYLASTGWAIHPLRGKLPATPHGVHDATSDAKTVADWWARGRYHGCNIGARVPSSMFVLDIDPRKRGCVEALAALELANSPLPATLTTLSGRGDGGMHHYYRHPGGKLTARNLPEGVDVKTSSGYVVMPPSIHPVSLKPYTWLDMRAPVDAPGWLVKLLKAPAQVTRQRITPAQRGGFQAPGDSVADLFAEVMSWSDILVGWTCIDVDGDADGARWLHPTATSSWSATIRYECIFVYSPNAGFSELTEAGNRHGYTKYHAYAELYHGGNQSAAGTPARGLVQDKLAKLAVQS
jgi:Bifunctional DNA primase/polymerase, N-terminal